MWHTLQPRRPACTLVLESLGVVGARNTPPDQLLEWFWRVFKPQDRVWLLECRMISEILRSSTQVFSIWHGSQHGYIGINSLSGNKKQKEDRQEFRANGIESFSPAQAQLEWRFLESNETLASAEALGNASQATLENIRLDQDHRSAAQSPLDSRVSEL